MSLLDDFNSICEAQDNSMEMKLRRYVQKDKYPLMFSMPEFCRRFSTHISKEVMFARMDPNRVYLVVRDASTDWVTQRPVTPPNENSCKYLIGTADDGMMSMSHEEYISYLKYHREQWHNIDNSTRRIEVCMSDLVLYGKPTKNYNNPSWDKLESWYEKEVRGFYIGEGFTFENLNCGYEIF